MCSSEPPPFFPPLLVSIVFPLGFYKLGNSLIEQRSSFPYLLLGYRIAVDYAVLNPAMCQIAPIDIGLNEITLPESL